MNRRFFVMASLGGLYLATMACLPAGDLDSDDEDVAEAEQAQCPVLPDKVALISILDQNSNPVIRVVSAGSGVPTSLSGVDAGTEYWFTNTSSPPRLSRLSYSVRYTDSQSALNEFVRGWTLSISCAQDIGESNWATWSIGTNARGTLFRSADPTRNDTYMGLYLQYDPSGRLTSYAWYRKTLLPGGFAYTLTQVPGSFTAMSSAAPTSMESGTWKYSLVVSPP